jgi:uncharacterized membrane protein
VSRPDQTVAPSHDDPLVRSLSEGAGGVVGVRARVGRARWWPPERVVVALVVVAGVLMVLAKQHCRARGFGTPDMFYHQCYSDIPALFSGRGIAQGGFPYLSSGPWEQVEYPVLTGLAMWVTGVAARFLSSGADATLTYFDVNVVAIVGWLAVTVWATARTALRRPYDAAMVALAPGIILAGTINWDLWAVGLTALAMLAWARSRPALAGVLLGLGTAAKFYPLLLLGPLLVLCFRAGRMRAWWRATVAAALAWLAVNLPFMVASFDGWAKFYRLSDSREAGFSSIWFTLQNEGHGLPADKLNLVAGGLFAACCVAVAAVALTARRRPRVAQLGFLVLAAFVLTNKVYSPQYVVWLVPLAVLARPRWRDFLIWQATEVVHFVGVWLFIAGYTHPDRALPAQGYDATVVAHILGTLWMVAFVVRDIYRPDRDPVRADGSDDPAGGVLDGAPDRRALRPAGGPAGDESLADREVPSTDAARQPTGDLVG